MVVTTESQYAIETVSLTKIFPDWWGRAKVVAVDDLDLRINHNEIYGFLGPNGSGKTTTIKMLLNLLHPTKGASFVYGGQISDTHISSRVGYLPEESYLYKYLTARETLNFYAQIFGLSREIRKSRIETLLDMVGLSGMGNRQIGTFSKGMARRIGLAQALINDPDILILDEPTSGMDPMGTRQMKDLFVELARRGKTILLCSHLLADVEDVCDRIGILYGGRMQVEGTVQELLQQKNETQIRSERLSESAVSKIKQIAASEGKDLEVTNPMDKLEGFFVKIVAKAQQENQRTSGADSGKGISGFLAEKPVVRSENVLDKLVSADMETASAKKPDTSTDTLKVEKTTSAPVASANDALLQQLTKKNAEPVETEVVSNEAEIEVSKPPVKKNVLDDLIGKKDEGATEMTHESEDSENA